MSSSTMPHTCYTWGYHGRPVAALVALVDRLGATVIDVRYSPYSRDEEWHGRSLARRLQGRYLWVPQFGNLSYRDPAAPTVLADPEAGVDRVRAILDERPVILLCLERSHEGCHRAQVADLLRASLGCEITPLGQPAVAQWELFG